MNDILLAFVTGLTTGGLSCLAVQGGLLAGSIAHEVEQNVAAAPARVTPAARAGAGKKSKPKAAAQQTAPASAQPSRAARPIVLFLAAKVVVYTALGFLLGLLGSVFQLTTTMRVALQVGIGIFMVGNALRMLNVHPIFRYFALEPPRFITRYIRRKSKGEVTDATPLFLGAMTVLIPCGVTQAMMAVAIASGSPVVGATTMFAFTLGTTPVFFALAYLATRLGQRLEKNFMRVTAIVVLVLGLISIDAALTLAGFPYSFTNLRMAMRANSAPPPAAAVTQPPLHTADPLAAAATPGAAASNSTGLSGAFGPQARPGTVVINVSSNGYSPQVARAQANIPLKLEMVSKEAYSCARSLVIPSLNVQQLLPESGTVTIDIPPQAAGSKLFYSCSMGMYSGVIEFEG
jgi:uncharacterized protein